jgi:hypothetical protein
MHRRDAVRWRQGLCTPARRQPQPGLCSHSQPPTNTAPTHRLTTTTTAEAATLFRVQQRIHRGGSGGPGDPLHEDVTFVAPVRVLFWKKWARTTMRREVDLSAGGGAVDVRFELIHSVSERGWGALGLGPRQGRVALSADVPTPSCYLQTAEASCLSLKPRRLPSKNIALDRT